MRELLHVLKLGSIAVSVYADDDLLATTECEGMFIPDPSGYKIIIDANLEPELAGQVFMHELLEAIFTVAEIDLPHEQLQVTSLLLAQALEYSIVLDDEDTVETFQN